MPLNKASHERNNMPRRATMEQRIQWHAGHARNCDCRSIPKSVETEIKRRERVRTRGGARSATRAVCRDSTMLVVGASSCHHSSHNPNYNGRCSRLLSLGTHCDTAVHMSTVLEIRAQHTYGPRGGLRRR